MLSYGKLWLTVFLVWAGFPLLAPSSSFSADDYKTPNARMSVLGISASGEVIIEGGVEVVPGWVAYSLGDPLTLVYAHALSTHEPLDEGAGAASSDVVPVPKMDTAITPYQMVVKHRETDWCCGTPLRPCGLFFSAEFHDGAFLIIRVLEGTDVEHLNARYEGEDYELEPIDVARAVSLQMTGKPPRGSVWHQQLEYMVSYADSLSYTAFKSGEGQSEALESAAHVVVVALQRYCERYGQYPFSICQLIEGPYAVVGDLPFNPYQFGKSLSETEFGLPRPAGGVRYYPEMVNLDTGPDSAVVVGYWLAILGEGKEAHPELPLPSTAIPPLRAVRWIEDHPAAGLEL